MSFTSSICRFASTAGLKVQKHAPEIFVGVGIVGFVGTVYLACKATTKAEAIMDEHQKSMGIVKSTKESYKEAPQVYSETDYKRDVATVYLKTGVNFVKLYWPAITLGVVSTACILKGYNILSTRNFALMAAYKGSEEAFSNYRQRVVEKLGTKAEEDIRYGVHKEEIEVTDSNGKTKTKKVETVDPDVFHDDPSRLIFDEFSSCWQDDAAANQKFLCDTERFCNQRLEAMGYLFLNEVREALGYKKIPEGQLLGWILPKGKHIVGDGDGYVSFGLFNRLTDDNVEGEIKRQFFYGDNPSVLLEFNYDGVIFDKI